MNEHVRESRLRVALKVIAFVFVVPFLLFVLLVLLDSPLVAEGSLLGSMLRWHPYNKAYEMMIATIYIVWGLVLWKASVNPNENRLLIEFAIWGNLAHAGVMLISALLLQGEVTHTVGDVMVLIIVGGVLLWLRPSSRTIARVQ